MDCIHLAQNRDKWRGHVHMTITFKVNKILGISLQPEEPLASQEGLCSMNFVTEMRHPITETSTILVLDSPYCITQEFCFCLASFVHFLNNQHINTCKNQLEDSVLNHH